MMAKRLIAKRGNSGLNLGKAFSPRTSRSGIHLRGTTMFGQHRSWTPRHKAAVGLGNADTVIAAICDAGRQAFVRTPCRINALRQLEWVKSVS